MSRRLILTYLSIGLVLGVYFLWPATAKFDGQGVKSWNREWDQKAAIRQKRRATGEILPEDLQRYRGRLAEAAGTTVGLDPKDEASLARLLGSEDTSGDAAEILRQLNGGTTILCDGLSSTNARVRYFSATALERDWAINFHKETIPLLVRHLGDESTAVRVAATKSLHARAGYEWFHAMTDLVAPAAISNLLYPIPDVRKESASLLREIGVNSRTGTADSVPALPQLKKLLDDPDPQVRLEANRAIAAIEKLK